jgi:4-hydroxy-2-oxoheptanedioate aldolase
MDDVFVDASGQPRRVRGVTVNSGSPLLVRLAAQIGWESIWIDMEHGPSGFEKVESLCTAADAGGIVPLVRLPDGERHHVLRALEAGARIILVPMVDDAAYARKIVEYGKYPPAGARGFNTRTPGLGFGLMDPVEAMARANARTHLFAQIETTTAVEQVDDILAVEGLSGIFIGPGDLSVNLGVTGQMADPRLREMVLSCISKAKAAGKLTGIFTVPGPLLSGAMEAGCNLVVCGGDVINLAKAWTQLLTEIPEQ